jgi:hypothetical protein
VDSDGKKLGEIKVINPVGMFFDPQRNMVFVGSKKGSAVKKVHKSQGAVYGIDIESRLIVKTFALLGSDSMSHPTGQA